MIPTIKSICAVVVALLLSSYSYGTVDIPDFPIKDQSAATPVVMLDMSVETPTAGAANPDQSEPPGCTTSCICPGLQVDGTKMVGICYRPADEYVGYFDPEKCYSYDGAVFRPTGCGAGTWNGNFMNWATMTAIDIFRFAMTGGDRAVDTATETILQRTNIHPGTLAEEWFAIKRVRLADNVIPNTVTPFPQATIYITSNNNGGTGREIWVGTTPGTDNLGRYTVKVQVCVPPINTEHGRDLCQSYPNSGSPIFKPIGLIQRNARKLRFGIGSYLNDNSPARDGGVIRALAKYVGDERFVLGLGPGSGWLSNLNREWDPNTGILYNNPDNVVQAGLNCAQPCSGVINYINRFAKDNFKLYDPISELYYEILRYFKGLRQPTAEYIAGTTEVMKDNFPVYGLPGTYRQQRRSLDEPASVDNPAAPMNWDDPIVTECTRSFIVAINDANPWLDKRLPGSHFTTPSIAAAPSYQWTCGGPSGVLPIDRFCTWDESTMSFFPAPVHDHQPLSNPDPSINVTTLTNEVGQLEGLHRLWRASGSERWRSPSTGSPHVEGDNDGIGGGVGTFDERCDTAKTVSGLGQVLGTCSYPGKLNSYYIAGLAHYANTTDLRHNSQTTAAYTRHRNRPERDPKGPVFKMNVKTYVIDTQEYDPPPGPLDGSYNMLWLAGKYGAARLNLYDPPLDGARSRDRDPNRDPRTWRALDGSPLGYFLANKPTKMVNGLKSAFAEILGESTAAASASTTTSTVRSTTQVFIAKYSTNGWYSRLYAHNLNADGTVGAISWEAQDKLGAISPSSRQIITRNNVTNSGVPFTWSGGISPTQQTMLGNDENVLNWLRGERNLELGQPGGYLRSRDFIDQEGIPVRGVLADIVDSSPFLVSLPTSILIDSQYRTFRNDNQFRIPHIYVGANDGMLHALNAGGDSNAGKESMAYVPNAIFPKLRELSAPDYGHKFTVNGSPFAADVKIGGAWRTLLVSGLSQGGQGYFALDITDPTRFTQTNAASLALWEFTDRTDIDLGYTYNQPIYNPQTGYSAQLNYLQNNRWAVIVGNGFGSENTDDRTGTGRAALFILYVEGSQSEPWPADRYKKILMPTPEGNGPRNGLATPLPLDLNRDGRVDTIYVGDLKGNVYLIDIGSGRFAGASVDNPTVRVIFKATDSTSRPQPITAGMAAVRHPENLNRYIVLFGTGKYLENGDPSDPNVQSFYGIYDLDGTTVTRAQLQQQTITSESGGLRVSSANSVNWSTRRGWYIDLLKPGQSATGERVVFNPTVRASGVVFFPTLIPTDSPCIPGGNSFLMAFVAATGAAPSRATFDADNNGRINSGDLEPVSGRGYSGRASSAGMIATPVFLGLGNDTMRSIAPGSTGGIDNPLIGDWNTFRNRITWRELRS